MREPGALCVPANFFSPPSTSNIRKLGVGKETTLGKTIQPKAILVKEFCFELTAVQLFKKYF